MKNSLQKSGQRKTTRRLRYLTEIAAILLATSAANCFLPIQQEKHYLLLVLTAIASFFTAILPILPSLNYPSLRLKIAAYGAICLEVFAISSVLSLAWHIYAAFRYLPGQWGIYLLSLLIWTLAMVPLFWAGMIASVVGAKQLTLRLKLLGILLGWVPLANIGVLWTMILKVQEEVRYESRRLYLNEARKDDRVCATRYPILLVHGIFGKDHQLYSYWGRIPKELEQNGATVYFGNHQSAASVAQCAEELTFRIEQLVKKTGCEKVNIIAHSKGGLDCRRAITFCGAAPYVASLTTVSTPHRGCEYADYLLKAIPEKAQNKVAATYNRAMQHLGEHDPDFLAAIRDLTADGCRRLNEEAEAAGEAEHFEGIFTQSYGSVLSRSKSGGFPMNLTYLLAKFFVGPNDGLVSETSFAFGERYQLISHKGDRGISHLDTVDLLHQNLPDFDIREFYVELVSDLKNRGL